ncbi:fibrillin-1 isoform X1 [Drosophila pseudoobscura]|uniref:Fibrillin-1 isoform X1 n=1 Tax=Drosophila pseudoobscura pseudoobscura TaxID=46245 RepID=A0A6I8W8N1_DROPS|nr:fibrillin-1 isoform X1 [Drosophila pseudoobscura]XP_033238979.1 fibrillin-1 isoform X1 [Drosophila pseudoobscura]XP_033238980.1 fibrillin-1 isoform X1 [Drosophila pseudoobscura]
MWAVKYVLCALSCVAFAAAALEDCEVAPLVRHATAKIALNDDTITATYTCKAGFDLRGAAELICNSETDKWQGEPPSCVKASAVSERKKRVLAIPEEPKVPLPLAAILDLSCIEAKVMAPEISHGLVVKYERRRRGEKIFLVAYFACNENYEFEFLETSAMYCHDKQWVGELPTCIPQVEYTDGDGGDGGDLEGEDYDEYETITNDDDNDTDNLVEEEPKVTESEPPPPPPPPVEEEVVESVEEATQPTEPVKAPVEELPVEVEPQPEVLPGSIDEPKPEPEIVVRVDEAERVETPIEPEVKVEEVTEINVVVEPTKDPYTPRFLDEDCGEDRGGCEHICKRLLYPDENEPVLKCSCREGYTLDPSDYVSCLDIDECQELNGGCSEICNNLPGSFQCACQKGYQLDASTGKSCVDIDECTNAELSSDCQNGCENLPGSYRCVVALVTQEEAAIETALSEPTEEDNEISVEEVSQPSPKVQCNPGFQLSPDGSECQDIDECDIDDGEDEEHPKPRFCQQKCQNTIGSYRCHCHSGYHLLEDKQSCALDGCQDLDNPKLNRTRCAHECENLPDGNYKCKCPQGYDLAEDQHSCVVAESACTTDNGHDRCRPGSCVPSEDNSSFSCLCPPGYTSEVFSCQDIDECAEESHLCSHSCLNTDGGYQCLCPVGLTLVEEFTCVAEDLCEVNNNGCEQICLTARGGACSCRDGFRLGADGKGCQDVDECQVENGGCQQVCRNLPGSYGCECSPGYELLRLEGLRGYCFDIDECAREMHKCHEDMLCENLNGSYTCLCPAGYALGLDNHIITSTSSSESSSTSSPNDSSSSEPSPCLDIDECSLANGNCSHFCLNLPGRFQCACPLGYALAEDGRTCQDIDECLHGNGQCKQLCLNQPGGFACACESGFEITTDGFGCLDIDECSQEYGNCSDICINLLGTHACACERGYELSEDGRSCQDIDECAGLLSGGCTHECINKKGSFECGCPLGYILQEDNRSCRPALVGCPPGSQRTSTSDGCEPIKCGLGLLLGADGSCVDVDECQLNNGGCSHRCENSQGSFKCACPAGYQLDSDLRTCQDVDECSLGKENCLAGSCVNEPGGFRCECSSGKRLSIDGRTCLDVPQPPRASPLPELPKANPFPTFPELPKARPEERLPPALPVLPKPNPFPSFPELGKAPKYPSAAPEAPRFPSIESVNTRLPQIPWVTQRQPQPRDACPRFQAPANGKARCNKYRHKRTQFYNSRCRVTCNPGFTLQGSEIRSCGSAGVWEGQENKCVPLVQRRVQTQSICPALKQARNGVISPASCTQGPSSFGAICHLRCNAGFVPTGPLLASCMALQGWSFGSDLNCQPFGSSFFNNQLPWIRSQSLQNIPPVQQTATRARPYIKCPENVVILLHRGEVKAHVTLQRPETNLDYRNVAVFPAWAKQLEAHLPAGIHKIGFRAQDPQTRQSAACQTIITIKAAPTTESNLFTFSSAPVQSHSGFSRPAAFPTFSSRSSAPAPAPFPTFPTRSTVRQPAPFPTFSRPAQFARLSSLPEPSTPSSPASFPRLDSVQTSKNLIGVAPERSESFRVDLGSDTSNYCPPSIEVHLKENQNLRSVVWEEPRFEGKLLKIFKSHFPGALFRLGDHAIKYEATTTDGVTLSCSFHIHVKAAKPSPAPAQPEIAYPESESESLSLSSAPAQLREKPAASGSLFDGHESYVVCPDKEPVRVTAHQSVNLPVGCTLKNVRPQSSPQTHLKRGTLTSLWHRYNANF